MNWDAEVDVVCTEAGLGGLASAIATVDGGGDVFVASSTAAMVHASSRYGPRADRLPHWLGIDVPDSADHGILRRPFLPTSAAEPVGGGCRCARQCRRRALAGAERVVTR